MQMCPAEYKRNLPEHLGEIKQISVDTSGMESSRMWDRVRFPLGC